MAAYANDGVKSPRLFSKFSQSKTVNAKHHVPGIILYVDTLMSIYGNNFDCENTNLVKFI